MSKSDQKKAVSKKALSGRTRRASEDRVPEVKCQICASKNTIPGLDLGHQPVGDLIVSRAGLNRPETLYPMQLYHCLDCGLTQLGYTVNAGVVYKNFPFVSGTTKTATRHLQSLATKLVRMLDLGKNSFAVDIGSNDGTLLKGYVPHGVKFLGVDPSGDPVKIANDQGLKTMHAFFNVATAKKILAKSKRAKAITACGCFAHISDLPGVMGGVKMLLAKGGVFATDSQSWLDMVERLHYDNIFHQHLRYYSMRSLIHLFGMYDMDVFDVERSEVYGGSIRVYSCHKGDFPISKRVHRLLKIEDDAKLYDPKTYAKFTRAIEKKKRKLFDTVYALKAKGKKVIGIGAPAKASTVSNYCGLGTDMIDYITEVNPLRTGMYLPGTHIPIIEEEYMFVDEKPADAAILFSWNYANEILPKLKRRNFRARIILP